MGKSILGWCSLKLDDGGDGWKERIQRRVLGGDGCIGVAFFCFAVVVGGIDQGLRLCFHG